MSYFLSNWPAPFCNYKKDLSKLRIALHASMPLGIASVLYPFFGCNPEVCIGALGVILYVFMVFIFSVIRGGDLILFGVGIGIPLILHVALYLFFGIKYLTEPLNMVLLIFIVWAAVAVVNGFAHWIIYQKWFGNRYQIVTAHGITLFFALGAISAITYTSMDLYAGYVVGLYTVCLSLFCYLDAFSDYDPDDYNKKIWKTNTGNCPESKYVNVLFADNTWSNGRQADEEDWSLTIDKPIVKYHCTGHRSVLLR